MTNAFDWKNWVCPVNGRIKWGVQNLDNQRGQSVAKRLEEARMDNRGYGTIVGMGKETLNLLPREFHVFTRARPKK